MPYPHRKQIGDNPIMTDLLEQLKQELLAKLQASSKPERSPVQGTIPTQSPFAPADEVYLLEVLTECRAKLDAALATAERYPALCDLKTNIADAITGIHQAAAIVIDPELYQD
jgi:hypothetical protein